MIVLHYIPTLTKRLQRAALFAQTLHAEQAKTMETHLISGKMNRREFLKYLLSVNPDVVHIHGCWDYNISCTERWALQRGYPIVLSLHGGLDDSILRERFWKEKLPRLIIYQWYAVRHATVLHADSETEYKGLQQLGWRKRMVMIPLGKTPEQLQQMCDAFHALYQKAIDTTARNTLKNKERRWLWTLLRISATPPNAQLFAEEVHDVRKLRNDMASELSAHHWRTIQIYAIDHGVQKKLQEGVKRIQGEIPDVMEKVPPRFMKKEPLHLQKSDTSLQKLRDYEGKDIEKLLAERFYRLYSMLIRHRYVEGWEHPYCILLEIYSIIRWQEYDETTLCEMLRKLSLTEFAERLFAIMMEYLDLPIGFMPLDPREDKETEKIRSELDYATLPAK